MTQRQQNLSHSIIHGAATSTAAIGFGLAQIPGSDNLAITPIQIAMIVALGDVFDTPMTKTSSATVLSALTATIVGRGISQIALGWIPGLGNVINASTAFTITEAIGWTAVEMFEEKTDLITV